MHTVTGTMAWAPIFSSRFDFVSDELCSVNISEMPHEQRWETTNSPALTHSTFLSPVSHPSVSVWAGGHRDNTSVWNDLACSTQMIVKQKWKHNPHGLRLHKSHFHIVSLVCVSNGADLCDETETLFPPWSGLLHTPRVLFLFYRSNWPTFLICFWSVYSYVESPVKRVESCCSCKHSLGSRKGIIFLRNCKDV